MRLKSTGRLHGGGHGQVGRVGRAFDRACSAYWTGQLAKLRCSVCCGIWFTTWPLDWHSFFPLRLWRAEPGTYVFPDRDHARYSMHLAALVSLSRWSWMPAWPSLLPWIQTSAFAKPKAPQPALHPGSHGHDERCLGHGMSWFLGDENIRITKIYGEYEPAILLN